MSAMNQPIYINRPLINGSKLSAYAEALGLKNVVIPVEMHVTLAYSRDPVNWESPAFIPDPTTVVVEAGRREIKRFDGGAVVMVFESKLFQQRWARFVLAGASWDYADYSPHVTLAYDDETDLSGMLPYTRPLKFGPERRQVIGVEWSATTED